MIVVGVEERQDPLARHLDGLERAGGVFATDEFVARLLQELRAQWDRLRELPADDEFWVGTNGRATWYKLDRFCELRLARDPSDESARWAAAAYDLARGELDGLPLFAAEMATRAAAVHEMVAMAEWVWLLVGTDPTYRLRAALAGVHRSAIERFAGQLPETRATAAARVALCVLDGTPFPAAIDRAGPG